MENKKLIIWLLCIIIIFTFVSAQEDNNNCSKFSKFRNLCYTHEAKSENNTDICKEIDSKEGQNNCIKNITGK